MPKVTLGTSAFPPPMPQTILGTRLGGRANFMALGWLARVNYKPPMLAIGVNKGNQSHIGILENRAFSVNIPSVDMVEITDYTGLVSGKKVDKSGLFDVFYGESDAAPMISECPLNIECRLVQSVDLPTNYLFIGELDIQL